MFSLALIHYLSACSMYDEMSMKPHKTTISTNTSMTDINKADDDKDQEKQSIGLQIKQEFIWKDN
tara:strand:+ start:589 stop:783 length:195 start_codon:yes stop_codon:yes gene_type:complete